MLLSLSLCLWLIGGDVGSLALSVPSIRKEWKYLVVTVIRCEDLPIMDGKVGKGWGEWLGWWMDGWMDGRTDGRTDSVLLGVSSVL